MTPRSLAVSDDGPVRVLQMTGVPSRGNPLSAELIGALLDALRAAEADPGVAAIVLTGTDRHFSVGADIREFNDLTAAKAILGDWLEDIDSFRNARKPTIAAVRGYAVGGGFELALYCDMMICAADATLGLPETGIGVIAGQGGTQRLTGLAGKAIASDMILTGRTITGVEAATLGIASRAVAAADTLKEAVAAGHAIGSRSAPAIRFAREILREASEGHLRQSLRIERLLAALILDTDERRGRTAAFLARKGKTPPPKD